MRNGEIIILAEADSGGQQKPELHDLVLDATLAAEISAAAGAG